MAARKPETYLNLKDGQKSPAILWDHWIIIEINGDTHGPFNRA